MTHLVAEKFLSLGLQSWGQSEAQKEQAEIDYLTAAGFDLSQDRAAAMAWLQGVVAKMPRGKYEVEANHLSAALDARKAA